MNRHQSENFRRTIARWTAPAMFWLALVFLICQAVLVVLWVDIPNLQEAAMQSLNATAADQNSVSEAVSAFETLNEFQHAPSRSEAQLQDRVVWTMMVIWPIVFVESVFHWVTRSWNRHNRWFHFYALLFAICPSLRLCARSPEMDRKLWLPGIGWRRSDKRLRRRLERAFSLPMIAIALLILPVLIIEFFFKPQVAEHAWLRMALHVSTGIIWFAFAVEFILMISVAEKKLVYIKRNWIDLAIILLPLLSFMRSVSLVRSTKLAKLLRVSQLTRLASMYRMRATAIKALRALILLDVIERLISRDPHKQIRKMESDLQQRQLEVRLLQRDLYRARRELDVAEDPVSD